MTKQRTTPGPVEDWAGAYHSYDLLKEIAVAVGLIAVVTVILAALFGAPSRDAVTFKEWATQDPSGFVSTTLDELAGASGTAGYGPPYNHTPDAAQSLFGVSPQSLAGVTTPVDTTEDLVLRPLGRLAPDGSDLATAIGTYRTATAAQQQAWTDAYRTALASTTANGPALELPPGDYGPVQVMMTAMLSFAQTGAADAALIDVMPGHPGFFVMDYTRSQLYLADGDYMANLGDAAGLGGDHWGMAATIGNWPGQVWLLPVDVWYQIPPGSTSGNGDIIVFTIAGLLGIVLIFLPYVPGLRSLPKRLGIYRLIWRRHYTAGQ
jgi:hypothetical protein